jgi:hypothetical protein
MEPLLIGSGSKHRPELTDLAIEMVAQSADFRRSLPVCLLSSHATLLQALDTGAVWSLARGLARHVDEYKSHLAACDETRRNDLDGRGNLSEENLAAFTELFLTICLDQVKLMAGLMQPDRLRTRILTWANEEVRLNKLPAQANTILEALLYRSQLQRGDVAALGDTGERQARRIVSALNDQSVVTSESTRASLFLALPATLVPRWMPRLFPEKTRGMEG